MIEIERVVCGMVNCYLPMGEHGAVLVDTGETADRERVVAACREKQVRLILLTLLGGFCPIGRTGEM